MIPGNFSSVFVIGPDGETMGDGETMTTTSPFSSILKCLN